MERCHNDLLTVLRHALRGEKADDLELNKDDWQPLRKLASEHYVLPMVAEALHGTDSALRAPRQMASMAARARRQVIRQASCTGEFLLLYQSMLAKGLDPVVTRGIICRSLYPNPELRPSVDEDLLIGPDDISDYNRMLLDEGLVQTGPVADINKAAEISYKGGDSPIYIELHVSLFAPDSNAYGDCNSIFEGVLGRTIRIQAGDVAIRTLQETDHLLYLICHAYKHFLHSGVGIRQVCDMGMLMRAYGGRIDFCRVRAACSTVRIDTFAAALFRIGERYLGFDMPEAFADIEVDEKPLLEDILSGGLYGAADVNRLHSSNMTLGAVAAAKKGKKGSMGLIRTLFPPRHALESQYPYLHSHPGFILAAWIARGWNYIVKQRGGRKTASESLRIGQDRIALMKQYGIIK